MVPVELKVVDLLATPEYSFPQLSVATGTSTMYSQPQMISERVGGTGASLSFMVIFCSTGVAAFPLLSLTSQVMVVVPTGYGASRASPSSLVPTGIPTPQLSFAVALATEIVAVHFPESEFTVTAAGAVMVGASLSGNSDSLSIGGFQACIIGDFPCNGGSSDRKIVGRRIDHVAVDISLCSLNSTIIAGGWAAQVYCCGCNFRYHHHWCWLFYRKER